MMPVMRFCVAAVFAAIAVTPVSATDLATSVEPPSPSAPPNFYVHAGAVGLFPLPNAQPTGGGIFPVSNIAIRPNYTLGLELGYCVMPNIAIVLSTGVPPLAHLKATGDPVAGTFGTNLVGSVRYGLVGVLLRYQFPNLELFSPMPE